MRTPLPKTMNNSSPKTNGHQHGILSPLERVSRPAKPTLSTPNTPVLEDFPQNDDEKERMQRRRSRVFDLQFSSDSSHMLASPNRTTDASTTISKFTNTQITEHYSTCIKLSTENKITTKNAFGLHLIDFMSEILKQKDTEPTNFKVAAGTLDASTKIYAVRVDAVHADVYRVLGGLGKDPPSQEEAESHGADGSAVGPETTKKTAKPKKKTSCKTIEQNLSNINVSEADGKCEVDPMFQKTAASFDECSTAGVFLSTLHCQDYRSELLFPSDMQTLSSEEPLELPDLGCVDMTDLKAPLQQCVEDRQLCPSLAGFQFTKWDSETHNESVSVLMDKFKKNDQVFDINAEVEDNDDGDVPDGPPMEDFDDNDEPDPSAAGDHEELGSWKELCQVQNSQEEIISLRDRDIQTMSSFLSMKPGEYSYFSPRTMKMWAGPDHWRFGPRPKQDTASHVENKKKSAKKDFEINFDDDIDFDAYFRKTKAATTLTKSTLENQNWKVTTLPTDFHYETDALVQLHLKPGIRLLKMGQDQKAKTEHYEEIEDYDYNNPNDTSNFCPGLQAADSDDEESDDLFAGPVGTFDLESDPFCTPKTSQENGQVSSENQGVDITTYGESNLVAEPQKVNKIEIQYAKTAKKMDMKKLKQNMWSLLTEFSRKEADTEANHSVNGKEGAPEQVADEKMLSGLTKDLQKRLPPLMAQNLSIPLAFACLLHLANEKNLKLEGTEDLSDVLVMQGD
ncbi:condensin complex subunit 2 isoform X1 [Mesocricetus auratus]|uniref:Condensin complex subunit 2 n=2 Tax=Mesocricetus auratus TaxID=10036 RepID=A0ABM2XMH2_MESAU|nr:condensin complex subunit 2 isoform X1 [Mesocricetus auratus]XP_040602175.1 condensin complex subunit 2 isoform X1 [Mesocricetus auratus]